MVIIIFAVFALLVLWPILKHNLDRYVGNKFEQGQEAHNLMRRVHEKAYDRVTEYNEFYKRRGKYHASWVKLGHILCHNPPGLPCAGFTQPPQCMPECYHQEDAVEAYRDYYRHEKSKFAQWNWGTPAPIVTGKPGGL